MNILFLTILKIDSISDRGVYPDLMRKFMKEGHSVWIVAPLERRDKRKDCFTESNNVSILRIKTLNIQKTSIIEKWMATVLINSQFKKGIKKYFRGVKFDLVVYSTPPITFTQLVKHIKTKYRAIAYLLLKDIFPQNAVDLGFIRKNSLPHRYYQKKEKYLYEISDYIGCMSEANEKYIKYNHPEVNPDKIEVNPNSHEYFNEVITDDEKTNIRRKYNIPLDSIVFIYGGNLGKPQGIGFMLEFLETQINKHSAFFLIAGSGTEYNTIKLWIDRKQPVNILLLSELGKKDYNKILMSSNVGMIFLDKRFTVPNFPSRIISYLEYKLPVLAATDKVTDLGKVILENDFGLWSEAGNIAEINTNVDKLLENTDLRADMGHKGFRFFLENYTVDISYNTIMNHLRNK